MWYCYMPFGFGGMVFAPWRRHGWGRVMRLSLEAHRGILSVVFRLKLIKNTRHCLQPLPTHQVAMYATLSTLPSLLLSWEPPLPRGCAPNHISRCALA